MPATAALPFIKSANEGNAAGVIKKFSVSWVF